jgi:ribokinase
MPHKRFDAVCVGYTALDYLGIVPAFPRENRKLEMRRFLVQGGGPAATAAVTLSRLGLTVAFIGKVGDDPFAERMLAELRSEGVDTASVVVEAGASSPFAFIMVDERTAVRTILWTRGTGSGLQGHEVDLEVIAACRGLLVDSLESTAARAAAAAARTRGIPVVIDAGTLREGVEAVLPLCDYIVASEVFAEQVGSGGGVEEALEAIMGYGPRAAVVTLGERGCVMRSEDVTRAVAGFTVDAVDTTGAGDVFHGAFLYAVIRGWGLDRGCVFANAVAALGCRGLGGREQIPDLTEALSFLRERVPGLTFER